MDNYIPNSQNSIQFNLLRFLRGESVESHFRRIVLWKIQVVLRSSAKRFNNLSDELTVIETSKRKINRSEFLCKEPKVIKVGESRAKRCNNLSDELTVIETSKRKINRSEFLWEEPKVIKVGEWAQGKEESRDCFQFSILKAFLVENCHYQLRKIQPERHASC